MQRTISFVTKFFIVSWCFTACICAFGQEWQLEKSQQQVRVYSRINSTFQTEAAYKEILATTQVSASPYALLNLLNDIKRAPEWIDNCIKVEILAGQDEKTKLVQSTFSAPWPLLNRDMITQSISLIAVDQITIEIADMGDEFPLQKNTVRMTNIQGRWTITPMTEGNIEIRYQGTGNPAGNIPIWLANKVLIDSTFITFKNLSSIITEEMYQHSEITH